MFLPFVMVIGVFAKRYVWSYVKSQKYVFRTVKGREPPSQPPSS